MAPTSSRQTKSTMKKRAASPEVQQDSSPGSSAVMADSQCADEINVMIENALKENKNKRSKRTQQIQSQYTSKVHKSRKRVDTVFNQYENDLKTLRATQTQKLAALLKRKLIIEQKMLESVRKLDEAYKNGARDLQGIAKERREEIEKAMGSIKRKV